MHLHAADRSLFRSPLVRVWIDKCNEVSSGLTSRKFDDLLELSNNRYRSEYYATWLNQFSAQTPDNHADKEPLLAAVAYHQDSVFRFESTQRRDKIVQRVLTSGDFGYTLRSEVVERQDYTEDDSQDDAEFKELCDRICNDALDLSFLTRALQDYCGNVNDHCDRILVLPNSLELFMSFQPGPYPDIESKWANFVFSFRRSLKEDLVAESNVRRPQGP